MSFKHTMKFSDSIYVSVTGNYSVTVMYFNADKKYLGQYRTYSAGEHLIENISSAYYIGIRINAVSSLPGLAPITSIIGALKSSHFTIFDTKIASSLIKQTAD